MQYLIQLTFELLDIAQQEHVGVLHLQVKFDSLEQDSLQNHHLFLLKKHTCSWVETESYNIRLSYGCLFKQINSNV